MKLLFAHDHTYYESVDRQIYSYGFPASSWDRYLEHFTKVTVIARSRPADGATRIGELSIASAPNVSFAFVSSAASKIGSILRTGPAVRLIERQLACASAAVARLPSDIGLLTASLARVHRIPCALEVVAPGREAYLALGTMRGRLYAPVAERRLRVAASRASHVLYVTEAVLQRRYPTRGQAVGCSNVMLPDFDVGERLAGRLERRRARQAALSIGVAGTLSLRKGTDVMLAAFARVARSMSTVSLRFLGSGDQRPWHAMAQELGIADRVSFDGMLPAGAPVLAWMDGVDLYVQPSRVEGLPRTLIEAMSRGCVCLGASVDGIPELLPAAALHPPGDIDTLTGQIEKLSNDASLYRERAELHLRRAAQFTAGCLDPVRHAFWQSFAASLAS